LSRCEVQFATHVDDRPDRIHSRARSHSPSAAATDPSPLGGQCSRKRDCEDKERGMYSEHGHCRCLLLFPRLQGSGFRLQDR
jgi:hypothetical protein